MVRLPQRVRYKFVLQDCGAHGPAEGPRRARHRFLDTPMPTWDRWVKMARGQDRDLAQEAAEVVPRPDTILAPRSVEQRAAMRQAIDFYGIVDRMAADAELLCAHSTSTDGQGVRRMKNPVLLIAGNRLRAELVRIGMKHAEVVWSIERQ
jgi:hypothetical protein